MVIHPQTTTQEIFGSELDAIWLPFTANRDFRKKPRLIESAHGAYYRTPDGRAVLDSFSGLWTSGLGHCHPKIVSAVQEQVAKLDYSAGFQVANTAALAAAETLIRTAPEGFNRVFFTNSGSEAVDTALKLSLGYHALKGEGSRTRFVGREKAYHGCNFGGTSVGGIPANRKLFENGLLPGVDHLPHTLDHDHNAFSRGQPQWGVHLADDLQRIVDLRTAEKIAAVIVEPVSGSSGVIIPPAGYLERLREICTRHGILLIFDEVITAFYRIGQPFGCMRFNVIPDIIATAKGITNGVIPMGAVLVSDAIYQAYTEGTEFGIELFHGYTYSGHPVAAAAASAALEIYLEEDTATSVAVLEPLFESAIHGMSGAPHVIDIRNFGLMGAIELAPRQHSPGARGMEAHIKCFEAGLMVRNGMDTLQFAPFLNSTADLFEKTFSIVRNVLETIN
jgi:beta-alanine--pyruvate transaminase